MSRSSATSDQVWEVDLAVFDRDDERLLLVEVKIRVKSPEVAEALRERIRILDFPFGMLVDGDRILLFARQHPDPVAVIPTAEVFGFYDPNFRINRLFIDYLRSLAEGWLADFAIAWKSEAPPFARELNEAGLGDRLAGCTIDVDRRFQHGPPLSRNQLRPEFFDRT